ncbi:RNA polymerase subunit sigma-24 [Sphingobium limneticum]|uniref:glycosyl hydrolase n=1 Tax=Sphingobium limneticum TaxID=1007511 RepID=UPI00123CE7B4|nr:glycosyl hydrolase [Sphingobium limneticum]KAA9013011.1 RNA polymerase subunit sigma-24 [Sphingobium limneticum]
MMGHNRGGSTAFIPLLFYFLLFFAPALPASGQERVDPDRIDWPEKIGVGTWPVHGRQRMVTDVDKTGARWFYDWSEGQGQDDRRFVPMVWGRDRSAPPGTAILLAFNEPDEPRQAALSVGEAIRLWPKLMATGARLSSPATSRFETLGPRSWQERFMSRAEALGYRIDFMAVHYYATDPDVAAFEAFLQNVHARYNRPIWVTEWALADWVGPIRFSAAQQRAFFEKAVRMLDDLPFVERHAWFGSYAGLDGSALNSELVDGDGRLTDLGERFRLATAGNPRMPQCDRGTQETTSPVEQTIC